MRSPRRSTRAAPTPGLEELAEIHRRHALIEAPIEDVWAVVTDPKTHSEWWPEVQDVRVEEDVAEGSRYVRFTRRMGFLDLVDTVWVVERLEHLKEAQFRCTASGAYTRFALTPAQEDTFVEIEAGIDPTDRAARLMQFSGPLWMRPWLRSLLDALPDAVRKSTASSRI